MTRSVHLHRAQLDSGVLLIAAAVLMMQVVIDTHPHWFETAAERADARLLALCVILGMTSWTSLCRLLRGETLKLRAGICAGGAGFRRVDDAHPRPACVAQSDALGADRAGDGFFGLVLAEAVLSYVGIGVDPGTAELRYDDQRRAHGTGPRTDGVVEPGGRLHFHVRAGAGGQPVRRCGATPSIRAQVEVPRRAQVVLREVRRDAFAGCLRLCLRVEGGELSFDQADGSWVRHHRRIGEQADLVMAGIAHDTDRCGPISPGRRAPEHLLDDFAPHW
jgi:hypothetical protein